MISYTDKTAIQNYLLQNIDASFDTQIASWITAMSRFMDGYCGCTLVETTPATRLYDGTGYSELKIDDVYTITAVVVDGTTVTPATYPANSARKYLLKFAYDTFTVGMQNVSVTGNFGRFKLLADCEDIKFACTVLVAGIVNQSNKQTDGIQSEQIGEYKVTYTNPKERADYDRAMQILNTYRKITF